MCNFNTFPSSPIMTVCLLLSSSVTLVSLIYNNKLYRSNYVDCQPLLKTAKSAEMWYVLNTSSLLDVVGEAFFVVYIAYTRTSHSCLGL
jgi:hypothetical protein